MEGYSLRLTIMMPFLILGSILLSIIPPFLLFPDERDRGTAFGIICGISLGVTAVLLHFGAGWLLNRERTPDGQRWRNKYQIGSIPVQFAGIPYALVGWAIASYNIGKATSVWVGWPVFVLVPIAVGVGIAQWRDHLRRASRTAADA
jgi:cytochrome bd-type quinol oxidase subunit 2